MAFENIPDNGLWSSIAAKLNLNFGEVPFKDYQVEVLTPIPNTASPVSDDADIDLATNWQSLYTLTTPIVPGGLWKVFTQCLFGIDVTNRTVGFRFVVDGFALGALKFEGTDVTDDYIRTVTLLPVEFGLPNWDISQAHTVELQSIIAQGPGGAPTLTINNCFTSLERKA